MVLEAIFHLYKSVVWISNFKISNNFLNIFHRNFVSERNHNRNNLDFENNLHRSGVNSPLSLTRRDIKPLSDNFSYTNND